MEYYVQSPIGLVPKAGGKTRLIFHLSFDFGSQESQKSVNYHTPKQECSVKYNDLDHAVANCLSQLRDVLSSEQYSVVFAKTDCSHAFRIVPTRPDQRFVLLMCAYHPVTKQKFYFVDKCLPFGSSKSCAIFQSFSDALKHITDYKISLVITRPPAITNYLDDFLFISLCIKLCNQALDIFLSVCKTVNCPISDEKTERPTEIIIFLGTLLNGRSHTLSIPQEKIEKTLGYLRSAVTKKKATIKFIQRLTGLLNFLHRAIVPGRAFTRGMYDRIKLHDNKGRILQSHHHITLTHDFTQDCWVWIKFLNNTQDTRICRPFVDFQTNRASNDLFFFSDASKAVELGMGAIFNYNWSCAQWPAKFIKEKDPSIEFLELFALAAGLFTWKESHQLKNARINIYCDNQAVMYMVNSSASSCPQCRKLIRLIACLGINNNVRITVKFVRSQDNILADSLSRLDHRRFWANAPKGTSLVPDEIPEFLWPPEKIWEAKYSSIDCL